MSSRTPATSPPGTSGSVALRTYELVRVCVSAKFSPARVTLISTSPSAGSGRGSSASVSTSGPPNSVIWIARIGAEASEGPAKRREAIGGSLAVSACSKVRADVNHRGRLDRL